MRVPFLFVQAGIVPSRFQKDCVEDPLRKYVWGLEPRRKNEVSCDVQLVNFSTLDLLIMTVSRI
jgi:hypothetical protein